MITRTIIIEILGWIGAILSLVAYSTNSLNFIEAQSMGYLLMNVFGCSLLIVYTYYKKAYANSVLNSIWLLMTIVAIINFFV